MSFTKQGLNAQTYTKQAKPVPGGSARFGLGKFGTAKFGVTQSSTKVARPTTNFAKIARPS